MFYDSFIHKNCWIFHAEGNDFSVVVCYNALHHLPIYMYKNILNKSYISLGTMRARGGTPLFEQPGLMQAPVLCRTVFYCSEESETVNDSLQVCDTWNTLSIKRGTSCQPSQLSSSISVWKDLTEGYRCQLPSSNNHWICCGISFF